MSEDYRMSIFDVVALVLRVKGRIYDNRVAVAMLLSKRSIQEPKPERLCQRPFLAF